MKKYNKKKTTHKYFKKIWKEYYYIIFVLYFLIMYREWVKEHVEPFIHAEKEFYKD